MTRKTTSNICVEVNPEVSRTNNKCFKFEPLEKSLILCRCAVLQLEILNEFAPTWFRIEICLHMYIPEVILLHVHWTSSGWTCPHQILSPVEYYIFQFFPLIISTEMFGSPLLRGYVSLTLVVNHLSHRLRELSSSDAELTPMNRVCFEKLVVTQQVKTFLHIL
jgi:hypothetical protein